MNYDDLETYIQFLELTIDDLENELQLERMLKPPVQIYPVPIQRTPWEVPQNPWLPDGYKTID